MGNVRFGSITDIAIHDPDVRYALKSGSRKTPVALPLSARLGHRGVWNAGAIWHTQMPVEEPSTASQADIKALAA